MPCCRVSLHLSTLELAARMDQQLAPFCIKSVQNHLATSSRKSFGTDVRTYEKLAKHFSIDPDTVRLQPKEVILPAFDNFAALHNPVRPARTTPTWPTCFCQLVNTLASLYTRRLPSLLHLRLPYLFPLRFPRRLGSSYGSSRSPSVRAALGDSVSSEVRPGKTPSVI